MALLMTDYTFVLWLLKLGTLANLYFLVNTATLAGDANAGVIIPAQVLFAVSAYRCLFPVRYEDNVVFHDSVFSSVFVTRLLATFSEVAYILLMSHLLRLLNLNHVGWVTGLSWLMVLQVVICQVLVWVAVLTGRLAFYYYEELGWGLIFALNTLASAYLYVTADTLEMRQRLLQLNLLFGAVYLPFQVIHVRALRSNARRHSSEDSDAGPQSSWKLLTTVIRVKNRRTDAESWGGLVGLIWMTSYWATLIPMWVYYIVGVLAAN